MGCVYASRETLRLFFLVVLMDPIIKEVLYICIWVVGPSNFFL